MFACLNRAVLVAALGVNCAAPLTTVKVSAERAIRKRIALVETRVAAFVAFLSVGILHHFDAEKNESADEQQHYDSRRGPRENQCSSRTFNRSLPAALLSSLTRVRCLLVDRVLLLLVPLVDLRQRLTHCFEVESLSVNKFYSL